jgi:hypothetical protein
MMSPMGQSLKGSHEDEILQRSGFSALGHFRTSAPTNLGFSVIRFPIG